MSNRKLSLDTRPNLFAISFIRYEAKSEIWIKLSRNRYSSFDDALEKHERVSRHLARFFSFESPIDVTDD